jgi:small-conductance mechanosensitive channel
VQIFSLTFLDNTVFQWISAFLIVMGVLVVFRILRRILSQRASKAAEKDTNRIGGLLLNMLKKINALPVFLVAVYFGTFPLTLDTDVTDLLRTVAFIALAIQAAIWGNQIINFLLVKLVKEKQEDPASGEAAYTALSFILRLVLWTVVVLLILDNIPGMEVTSLITGLGIGGIAVALAVQNILQDLFASLSIFLDKPFVIGDFIEVDDFVGRVMHIGLKTTRVESLSGEELVFANSDLLNSRIRNYKKMEVRRVVMTVGVAYDTPVDVLAAMPELFDEVVEAVEPTKFRRAHLTALNDYSLDFQVVYEVQSSSYKDFMDVRHLVLLGILRRFEKEGIEIPFPTQIEIERGGCGGD